MRVSTTVFRMLPNTINTAPIACLPLNAIRAADEAGKRDPMLVTRGVDDIDCHVWQPVIGAVGVSRR